MAWHSAVPSAERMVFRWAKSSADSWVASLVECSVGSSVARMAVPSVQEMVFRWANLWDELRAAMTVEARAAEWDVATVAALVLMTCRTSSLPTLNTCLKSRLRIGWPLETSTCSQGTRNKPRILNKNKL